MYESELVAVPGGLAGMQAAISSAYFPLSFKHIAGTPGDVGGAMASASVGPLRWTRVQVDGPFCTRPREVCSDDPDGYILMLLIDGGQVELQRHRHRVAVAPGTLIMLNSRSFEETEQRAAGTSLAVSFSAQMLKSRFVDVDRWCMVPRDATQGTGVILRDTMLSCWRLRNSIPCQAAGDLAASLVHLLGVTFRDDGADSAFESQTVEMHFLRVRDLVAQKLGSPELSADLVANTLRISKSYLFSIMNAANTTLGHYILGQRLARSRELLADPALKNHSIGDIAFAAGFRDLSHFSRCFSQRFGRSPRAYRAAVRASHRCGNA